MARDPLVPVADFGFSGWKMEDDFSWSFRGLGSDSFFEAAMMIVMMMGDDDDMMMGKKPLTSSPATSAYGSD